MSNRDEAQEWTEERLKRLEKRIEEVYREAMKARDKSVDAFFAWFEKADEKKRKLLEEEKITEKQYQQWRLEQLITGNQYKAMRDKLAERMTHANEIAIAYVNDETPGIYSINRNWTAYKIEQAVGDCDFTLYDERVIKRLIMEDPSLLPNYPAEKAIKRDIDLEYGKKQITSTITSGILQGRPINEIAQDLMIRISGMNKNSAIRAARTATTGAQNAGRLDGYNAAAERGIKLKKQWIATLDGRTRHSHAALDGATVDRDKKFDNGCMYPGDPNGPAAEVYNCFVGETKVASDSDVVRSYKHKYNGKIISIKTAGGVQFTCTPNHPILTPNGWVAAELLNNGDNIIVTFGEQNVFGGVNPDIKHRFPRIDAIHKFGKKMGGQRACGLSVNFHGDVATSNVEIVTQERLLRNVRYSSGRNGIDKFLLKLSNKTLSSLGSLFEHFWSVCKTSFGFIGCKCKSLPFFKCSVSHSCEHGFGTIANRDGVLTEYSINDLPADTVIDGELLDRLSCKVFLDTIVSVDVSVLSTHVYNLQTENGYYFVNSIIPHGAEKSNGIFAIAKNCRCTMIAVLDDEPYENAQRRARSTATGKNYLISDMTYDEWEKWKTENAEKQKSKRKR